MNPFDIRHNILGKPLETYWGRMSESPQSEWTDESVLTLVGLAIATATVNLAPAAMLIQSGVPGTRYFSHLSYANSVLGYPMPRFNYVTPASAATKWGSKVGSRVGGKAAAKIGGRVAGRLVPGLGWGLLAYDVYDIAFNQSLWGFDLN